MVLCNWALSGAHRYTTACGRLLTIRIPRFLDARERPDQDVIIMVLPLLELR